MTEILYNGRCPICSAEISHYRARAAATGADLHFTDLNSAPLQDWGISPDQAMRRLHARHDGRIVSGFDAFLLIWQGLPRWRWLARVVSLPGLRHAVALVYDRVAAPVLYKLHLRREAKRAAA
jgi:predicted DCC family thiol-disulfide oxidoreductase YuxK